MWKGSAFGGVKGKSQMNDILGDWKKGDIKVDELITGRVSLTDINDAFDWIKQGKSIRTVVLLDDILN